MTAAIPRIDAAKAGVVLPFLIVTLIWGSTWTVIRGQLGVVPVGWSVCYRFAVASAAMFVVARLGRVSLRLAGRDHLLLLVMAGCIFCANFNLVYRAEQHVTSGLVAVSFSLLAVYNAVLGRIFLRQPLSRPFLFGSGVALTGIALLFAHEIHVAARDPHQVVLGIAITLVAVLFASIANVLQSTDRARAMAMPALLAWGMLWGALMDAAYAWIMTGPPRIDLRPAYVFGTLYLGVIASAFAFTLYFNLIRRIGPARGGYVNVLVPVIAMAFSTVLENYRWSLTAAAGGVLVLAGMILAMRARRPAR